MHKEFIEIDVENIVEPSKLRADAGDLSSLEHSIKKFGVLSPVILDEDNNLITGARRLQACKNADIDRIPAFKVHVKAGSMEALDIQSDENLCRLKLEQEDLDNHIQKKKQVMTVKTAKPHKNIFSWLKKLFS